MKSLSALFFSLIAFTAHAEEPLKPYQMDPIDPLTPVAQAGVTIGVGLAVKEGKQTRDLYKNVYRPQVAKTEQASAEWVGKRQMAWFTLEAEGKRYDKFMLDSTKDVQEEYKRAFAKNSGVSDQEKNAIFNKRWRAEKAANKEYKRLYPHDSLGVLDSKVMQGRFDEVRAAKNVQLAEQEALQALKSKLLSRGFVATSAVVGAAVWGAVSTIDSGYRINSSGFVKVAPAAQDTSMSDTQTSLSGE